MGVEHGKPQQFFMPDKGTDRPGRGTKGGRELQQAIQEMKNHRPLNVLSTEPKVDPSTPVTQPASKELKKIYRHIGKRSRQTKSKHGWNGIIAGAASKAE